MAMQLLFVTYAMPQQDTAFAKCYFCCSLNCPEQFGFNKYLS